eukprot:6269787-Amphidinium_carterae.1
MARGKRATGRGKARKARKAKRVASHMRSRRQRHVGTSQAVLIPASLTPLLPARMEPWLRAKAQRELLMMTMMMRRAMLAGSSRHLMALLALHQSNFPRVVSVMFLSTSSSNV